MLSDEIDVNKVSIVEPDKYLTQKNRGARPSESHETRTDKAVDTFQKPAVTLLSESRLVSMVREEQGEKSLELASSERHFMSVVATDEKKVKEEKKDPSDCPLVLIVDDELMNILLMKSLLEDRGIATDTASSGSAALTLV